MAIDKTIKTSQKAFKEAIIMPNTPEIIVYEKDKHEYTRWGEWLVVTDPKKCPNTGDIVECQKHITVNSGASLSLQNHYGREEIYKGLSGKTMICVNGEVFELGEGEELFLHRGSLHFSWNETDKPSKFHEIQQGPLCDEADILRGADKYKKPEQMNGDDEIIALMIKTSKERYDNGERVVYDYGHANQNMERLANADLLNIYQEFKGDEEALHGKMNAVLQKSKQLHAELTPTPPQCSVKKPKIAAE